MASAGTKEILEETVRRLQDQHEDLAFSYRLEGHGGLTWSTWLYAHWGCRVETIYSFRPSDDEDLSTNPERQASMASLAAMQWQPEPHESSRFESRQSYMRDMEVSNMSLNELLSRCRSAGEGSETAYEALREAIDSCEAALNALGLPVRRLEVWAGCAGGELYYVRAAPILGDDETTEYGYPRLRLKWVVKRQGQDQRSCYLKFAGPRDALIGTRALKRMLARAFSLAEEQKLKAQGMAEFLQSGTPPQVTDPDGWEVTWLR